MIFVSRLNYQGLRDMTWIVLALAFLCMALVRVPGIGHYANGAYRWLNYPVQWQPSELGKFALILFFAARLSKRDERRPLEFGRRTIFGRFFNLLERAGFFELVPYILIIVIMVGLLAIEPHMSATIQMLVIAATILFAAGIKLGWFVAGGALAGAGLTYIMFATDYMTSRLQMWRDPWSDPLDKGLQAIQSLMAIGSGGLTGLGLGQSRQKFLYLPEPQNDFVFSIVCEELGFIGAVLVLILFALLIIRGYWLALHARDKFGSLIIVSLAEGSITKLVIGVIILAVVMFIDGNVINPRMLSSNVEVHPVLVIVALLAGGKVGGVVGMLVAVPVAALLKLQFEKYVERRRLANNKEAQKRAAARSDE